MERWEVIERRILVVAGLALLGVCAWLAFVRTGPERIAWLALLLPCTFWIFWQAFFEDKLSAGAAVTRAERAMWASWLWSRRVVLGAIAALFVAGAVRLFASSAWLPAVVLSFLAVAAGWVAVYGGGQQQSAADDRRVHQERMKRYR